MSDQNEYYEIPEIGSYQPQKSRCRNFWTALKADLGCQTDRLFLWLPVLLGCGALTTFEFGPMWLWPMAVFMAIALFFCWFVRWKQFSLILFISSLMVLFGGFVAEQRVSRLTTTFLEEEVKDISLHGQLEKITATKKGFRLLISNVTSDQPIPTKIRLSVRGRQRNLPEIGQFFSTKATLFPINARILPEGYDYKRVMLFEGIGATGYITGQIIPDKEVFTKPVSAYLWDTKYHLIEVLESSIAFPYNGLAIAMLTGERRLIDSVYYQQYQEAGLAHLVAISGLHIGLIAGFFYFGLRRLLALSVALGRYYPTYKIAAAITLPIMLLFVVFVGAPVSAVRAALMASFVFIAILFDKEPLSYRVVALAALFILTVRPEEILSLGFQLSFLAVLTLIRFYDYWRQDRHRDVAKTIWFRLWKKAKVILLSSLAITTVTAPLILHSFEQVSLISPLSNLVAIPLIGLVIMPSSVLAILTSGTVFQGLFLTCVEWGLRGIDQWITLLEHIPERLFVTDHISAVTMMLWVGAGLWFMLWRARLKYLACLPFLIGFLFLKPSMDGILVTEKSVYYVQPGIGYAVKSEKGNFVESIWRKRWLIVSDLTLFSGCKEEFCQFSKIEQAVLPLSEKDEQQLCEKGKTLLLAPWGNCPKQVIWDYWEVKEKGPVFIQTEPYFKIIYMQQDYLNTVYKERSISLEP